MKWCFILSDDFYLPEFLGKIAYQVVKEGDECIVAVNSKIAEYDKQKYFPENAEFLSKVDWCIENCKKNKEIVFSGLSWKEFFPTFIRKTKTLCCDYNNSVEIISQLYQFFDFIIQKKRPDIIISEPPSNVSNGIAYHLCKKNNVIYLGLMSSRFENRIDAYDLEHTCSKYEEEFNKILDSTIPEDEREFARNFIEDFISHKKKPSYMKVAVNWFYETNFITHYAKRIKQVCRPWIRYLLKRNELKTFDYESENRLKNVPLAPLAGIKSWFRFLVQPDKFDSPNNTDRFFLFPLHVQPEASTSVLATYFYDQLNTVRNIAFSLPFTYKLYVKEHPEAIGTRPSNFYKELRNIPNVCLIASHEKVGNLIKNSCGIITLTSTIGMETVLVGKPVYLLGKVFYSYHPLCKKINSFEELKQILETDLINKPNIFNLEEINIRFIISYFRNTIPGDLLLGSRENDTNDYKVVFEKIRDIFKRLIQ
ncbi:MAG: hypothetical protein WC614_13400 [bacterium]